MTKERLTIAEIDSQSAVELPERNLFAIAGGAGGLIGIGVAIDNIRVPIDVNVEDNEVCVNVAAVAAVAACRQ